MTVFGKLPVSPQIKTDAVVEIEMLKLLFSGAFEMGGGAAAAGRQPPDAQVRRRTPDEIPENAARGRTGQAGARFRLPAAADKAPLFIEGGQIAEGNQGEKFFKLSIRDTREFLPQSCFA